MTAAASQKAIAVLEQATMQAVTHRSYGDPQVLAVEQVARPVPGPGEVLVRVKAAAVSIGDHHLVTGKPYLIRLSPFGGLPQPKHLVPGAALAGQVEAVGSQVSEFRPGDEVFGQALAGAFAEYAVVPATQLAKKPTTLTFDEAAAVPWGATALQGLRDAAGLKAGQKVLIVGASGGVGTWAVQIAKALGAEVTAVCSTRNVELVRGLGADVVLDYTREDFVTGGARFDVMMDMVGDRSISACRRVLKPTGIYVACSGGGGDWFGPLFRVLGAMLSFMFSSQKFKMFVMAPKASDLAYLKDLVDAGKARPIIERRYALNQISEALQHVGDGHAQGQTVIHGVGSAGARS